jgi:hypothetical protein
VDGSPKSLIKWGLWLQSIHKFRLMGLDSGWIVKVAVMPVRLGGGFCLCFYIRRLGGFGSAIIGRFGVEENGQRQRRFNSQLSAVSYELSAKQQQWQNRRGKGSGFPTIARSGGLRMRHPRFGVGWGEPATARKLWFANQL